MKRILFLDDEKNRHDVFEQEVINSSKEVIYQQAFNADQAIELIKQYQFDIIYLDHDLADAHYKTANGITSSYGTEKTGKEVAEFIAKYYASAPVPAIIIHSWNHGGVQRIASSLRSNSLFDSCVFAVQFNAEMIRQTLQLFC